MIAEAPVYGTAAGGHRPPLQPPCFDRVAPFYELLERIAFGNLLQRARTAFLEHARASRRILIVGEGNGRFLPELLRSNSLARINCVDASERMLRLAHERVNASRVARCARDDVRFHHADILSWQPESGHYDFIVTHFFLDCFDRTQLPQVIERISALAVPRADWFISDFALPPRGWRRWHGQLWLRSMYLFFRHAANLQTRELISFGPLLRQHGFELRAGRDFRFGLISAQLWQR